MATAATVDFDVLLNPIEGEVPSGVFLRSHPELSSRYYTLRQHRNDALEAERTLERLAVLRASDHADDPSLSELPDSPDWEVVASDALDLLQNHTKDLWIAAWLVEANTRIHGVAGFRDALDLCVRLSTEFWDSIYPRPDEDDGYGQTVSQLTGLDSTLQSALQGCPMLPYSSASWLDYERALTLEKADPEKRAAELDAGAISLSAIESDFRNAGAQALRAVLEDIAQAIEICKIATEKLDALCGKDDSGYPLGPSTTNIQKCLQSMQADFQELSSGLLEDSDAPAGDVSEDADAVAAATAAGGVSVAQRPVASRDEALQHLLRVADFFRKTEPHSPVSYALEQAVRWGRMPLPDLLKDLVSDEDVLASVFKRMGIAGEGSNSDE